MVDEKAKQSKGLRGENFHDSFAGNAKEQHGSSSNHQLKGGN